MPNLSIILVVSALFITYVACNNFGPDPSNSLQGLEYDNSIDVSDHNAEKRQERYAFGLGRRAYTYTSGGGGVKRLPVYNFGLGKRARPYSFGLGKRTDVDEDNSDQDFSMDSWPIAAQTYDKYDDIKRGRPYSFGLGKRNGPTDVDRRSGSERYNFGLGRR